MIKLEKLEKGEFFEDAFLVSYRYNKDYLNKMRSLKYKRYVPDKKAWEIPSSELKHLVDLFGVDDINVNAKYLEGLVEKEESKAEEAPEDIKERLKDIKPIVDYPFKTKPFPHQIEAFNKGYELKKFEAHWEKLRIEYAEAGMADDAIQKMYDYDRQQFNSERTCIERTQEFTAPAYESSEEEASPLMLRYQEAITTTDTYHETKSSFAWIGEIEDEHLLAALEQLSDSDLELITLYAYEEYDTVEISKLFGTTKQNISKKIRRITNFIKDFQIRVV